MSQETQTVETPSRLSLLREIDFRPLLLPACAFVAGIILHERFPNLDALVLVLACVLVAGVPPLFFLTSSQRVLYASVVLLCLACGFLRHAWRQEVLARDDVSRLVPLEGALLRVRGCLSTRPTCVESRADRTFRQRDFIRTRFHLDVDSVETTHGWQPVSGTVQVNVYDRADDFAFGDRIEILSRFTRPERPSSPGEFDYATYLLRSGVRLRTGLDGRASLGQIIAHHRGDFLMEVAHVISARLARVIDRFHPPREAGLLRCILLGERDAVDERTDEAFRLSGLSHLLTVSGLHVVILMGGLWLLLRLFLVRERVIAAVVILLSLVYAGMAGLEPSVVRAAAVSGVFAFGVLVNRRHDVLNALAAAGLLLLVANPDQAFFAGFQLSFVSVLGLAGLSAGLYRFLSPRMGIEKPDLLSGARHRLRVKANQLFIATLAVSSAAWLASQPLVAYHFNVLNPITLGLNLLLVPLFTVILLAAFLVLVIETVLGGFAVASVSNVLAGLLTGFSEAGAGLPGSWVNFASPPVWALWVYYGLLLLAACAPALGLGRRRPAILLLLFLCGLVAWQLVPRAPDAPELVVLDVGQGSAALVRSPDGVAALIDDGTFTGADVSRRKVIPYLVRSRVPLLDLVLLSHADADHTNGLPGLLENFTVKKVLLGEDFRHSMTGLAVERFLIERRQSFEYVRDGDRVRLGGVTLEVIHPPANPALVGKWKSNERSTVVRGTTPRGTFILFADASDRGFERLALYEDLSADAVLAAHHGGISGMEALAGRYHWPVVLFSAGPGFVSEDRLKAYRDAGCRTFSTADDGTITVRFAEEMEVETCFGAVGGGRR
jgi:competence protein ComEC